MRLVSGLILTFLTCHAVAEGPPVFIRHPQPLAVAAGHTLTLAADTAFEPDLHWEWRKDGVLIPGALSSRLTLFHPDAVDTGEYHAVALGEGGGIWSNPAAVIVLPQETGPGHPDDSFTDPGLDGPVFAVAQRGDGSILAGGEFFSTRNISHS